jgi:hypothetical protein
MKSAPFLLSYIVFEIPANIFTKWLGPGKAIPLYTITFGVLSIAFAFVRSFGAACAVRFLLGVAEAGMFATQFSIHCSQLTFLSLPARYAPRYLVLPVPMVHQGRTGIPDRHVYR